MSINARSPFGAPKYASGSPVPTRSTRRSGNIAW